MKTEIQMLPQPKVFSPFRLVLDIKTEEEARVLASMYGVMGTMADQLKKHGYGISKVSREEVKGVLMAVGRPVDDYLLSVGIDRVEEGTE